MLLDAFSQLSAVIYTPENENPIITRNSVQATQLGTAAYRISTAEIREPSAAKTRTWPTRWIIPGAMRLPSRKPAK